MDAAAARTSTERAVTLWSRVHGHVSLEIEGNFASMRLDPEALFELAIADRQPVDVAVRDLDEVLRAVAEQRREVLGDRHGAVAPARAADRDHQVRLALEHVVRQQELEQRDACP